MNEMSLANWMKKLLQQIATDRSALTRYYETEGLCKMQTAPSMITAGPFGGPAFTLAERRYCVRR
jgi:hypothetical protein